MPVTLSQIANNSAHIILQIQTGDVVSDLNVEYYPARINESVISSIQSFDALGEDVLKGLHALNDVLIVLVKSWDLYEDDAQTVMYPIERSALENLPVVFRMAVLQGIMENIRPNQTAPQIKN